MSLPELLDQPWWPNAFRDAHTLYLREAMKAQDVPNRICAVMPGFDDDASSGADIVDLCAGSGGPWRDILPIMSRRHKGRPVRITATDQFPPTDPEGFKSTLANSVSMAPCCRRPKPSKPMTPTPTRS